MLLKLIFKNIKNNKLIAIISIMVLSLSIILPMTLLFVYKNIENITTISKLGNSEKKVVIRKGNKSFLSKIYGTNNIEKVYKDIKNDKNIEKSFGIYNTKFPTLVNLQFLGFDFTTDMLVFSTDDIVDTGDNINIGISPNLLNIYNTQIADNSMFPKLGLDTLSSIKLKLFFGKNSFFKLKKNVTKNGHIYKLNENYPLFGISISKKTADNIAEKLGIKKPKLYKIILYVKDTDYIKTIKEKYKDFKVVSFADEKQKINKKLNIVKKIFNYIIYLVYILIFSFILSLSINIIHNNKNNLKVLYYHGANKIQRFLLVFGEVSIYLLVGFVVSSAFYLFLQNIIPHINNFISNYGIVNVKIVNISFLNVVKFSFIVYILIFLIFIINTKKKM